MRTRILALVLGALITMPCMLRADEAQVQLFVVLNMESIGGLDPMDNSDYSQGEPPRPNGFRVSISGNRLNVSIQDESVSSALVRVIQQSTNTTVVEQVIYDETTEYLSEAGLYSIEIDTNGGSLVGQFNVQ